MTNPKTTAAHHTPGPWHTCGQGACSCFTVMADDHPVAEVTHGRWGDDYPAIRLAGTNSLDHKAEAYMEQITYGSIGEATARANWHLIAAAPDLLAALQHVISAHVDQLPNALAQAHRAIAKARGGLYEEAVARAETTQSQLRQPVKAPPEPRKHQWGASLVGHGEAQCIHCRMTNREAAVLGQYCPR